MTMEHGGNRYELARRYQIPAHEIIDLSASINPLPLPPAVLAIIESALKNINEYPDPDGSELTQELAAYNRVSPENVVTGNGSVELIYAIAHYFRPRRALIIAPAFSEYERALTGVGCEVTYFDLDPEKEFELIFDDVHKALTNRCDQIWLANPANPSGRLYSRRIINELVRAAAEMKTQVVLDEAFIDFAPEDSLVSELDDHPNLLILRSLTKFFGLASLRIGYALAGAARIAELESRLPPWRLNGVAQAAACTVLREKEFIRATLEQSREEREWLSGELNQISKLSFYEPGANFFLLKLAEGYRASMLQEWLLKKDRILIRDCSNFRGLSQRYFRVAIGERRANERLIRGLKGYF